MWSLSNMAIVFAKNAGHVLRWHLERARINLIHAGSGKYFDHIREGGLCRHYDRDPGLGSISIGIGTELELNQNGWNWNWN